MKQHAGVALQPSASDTPWNLLHSCRLTISPITGMDYRLADTHADHKHSKERVGERGSSSFASFASIRPFFEVVLRCVLFPLGALGNLLAARCKPNTRTQGQPQRAKTDRGTSREERRPSLLRALVEGRLVPMDSLPSKMDEAVRNCRLCTESYSSVYAGCLLTLSSLLSSDKPVGCYCGSC